MSQNDQESTNRDSEPTSRTHHLDASSTEKIEVAKTFLTILWAEVHWRRETEQKVVTWTIGLFAAIVALIYTKDSTVSGGPRVFLALVILALGILACRYLIKNWRKGKEVSGVIVKLNASLGAWEDGYLCQDGTLFPDSWRNWGNDAPIHRSHISGLYCLLVLVAAITAAGLIYFK